MHVVESEHVCNVAHKLPENPRDQTAAWPQAHVKNFVTVCSAKEKKGYKYCRLLVNENNYSTIYASDK